MTHKAIVLATVCVMIAVAIFFEFFFVFKTPITEPIRSFTGYYLPFEGNISRIFVVSANASYGFYPYATRTSPGGGLPVVTNGEPCVVINVTIRNDYSTQYPPPNPNSTIRPQCGLS